jgi:uncharacterized protein YciI
MLRTCATYCTELRRNGIALTSRSLGDKISTMIMPIATSHRARRFAVHAGALCLLVACAASPSDRADAFSVTDFALVLLLEGDAAGVSNEELSQQHFAFIEAIASERRLLLAGAFGPERHRADLRGVFLIDESDPRVAGELTAQDPATVAGVYRQEVIPITTLDVVRQLPEAEKRRQERRLARGENPRQPDIQGYTVLMAPDGTRAAKEVFSSPAIGEVVVLMARMGAPREDELFAILDVPTAAEARARLKVANTGALTVHVSEWYGSPALAELAQERVTPRPAPQLP